MQTLVRWTIGLALLIGLASIANIWLGVAGFGIWMLLSRRLRHVTPPNATPAQSESPEAAQGMAESLASLTFDKVVAIWGEFESRLGLPEDPLQLFGMRLTLLLDPLVFCAIQYRLLARGILGDVSYRRFEASFDHVILTRLTNEAFTNPPEGSNESSSGLTVAQAYGEWMSRRHADYQRVLADKKLYGSLTDMEWVDEVFLAAMLNRELVGVGLTPPDETLRELAREVIAETTYRRTQVSDALPRVLEERDARHSNIGQSA